MCDLAPGQSVRARRTDRAVTGEVVGCGQCCYGGVESPVEQRRLFQFRFLVIKLTRHSGTNCTVLLAEKIMILIK